MPVDLRLKLLELTSVNPSLSMNDFSALPQLDLQQKLAALSRNGFVTFSDGVLSMDDSQRVMLAEQLIHSGSDPKKVSTFLAWQEFENFAEHVLKENGFSTRKHLIFRSGARKSEIDIFAWNDTFMLAVDCKHWLRSLSPGRMRVAAQAQIERAAALARKPELLYRLKIAHPEGRSIAPVILALGELRERLIDGVPVVSVSKLISFIYGVSPIDGSVRRIRVPDLRRSQLRLA
jgi:hypothetical protein